MKLSLSCWNARYLLELNPSFTHLLQVVKCMSKLFFSFEEMIRALLFNKARSSKIKKSWEK